MSHRMCIAPLRQGLLDAGNPILTKTMTTFEVVPSCLRNLSTAATLNVSAPARQLQDSRCRNPMKHGTRLIGLFGFLIGSLWSGLLAPSLHAQSATGGSISQSGNSYTHLFTTSGNFTVPAGGLNCTFLLLGGGGGGGSNIGGGGGGGGAVTTTVFVAGGTYTITIGAGGAGAATGSETYGTNGGNTTALGFTAYGGGAGSSFFQGAGHNGGCGGGGATSSAGGAGSQGNNGGSGGGSGCGGGGGTGSAGTAPSGSDDGAGGAGSSWTIGLQTIQGGAGGGAGGEEGYGNNYNGGAGGTYGGGAGGGGPSATAAGNNGSNYGCGGGGGSTGDMGGGSGSNGIVVITYTTTPAPPTITSATSTAGTVGTAFSYQIMASNSPTSYSATGLPAGLSLNTANGLISGTPTSAGTSSVSLGATNSLGTGTATLSITVYPQGVAPVITSSAGASGTLGLAFSYQIAAASNPTSYAATGLPAGLSVNTTSGLISGTPTHSGVYSVGLSATNTNGTGTATLLLAVGSSACRGGSITLSGTTYTHVFTANDTFTVPSGGISGAHMLAVGGGGGGGSSQWSGGGGGGGGVIDATGVSLAAGSYPVTVGAGGAPNVNGGNTTISSFTATGGGAGGQYGVNGGVGNLGGCGGGGSQSSGGNGVYQQGYPGGNGYDLGSGTVAGGGGGRGYFGGNGNTSTNQGGNGGPGYSASFSTGGYTVGGGGGGGGYSAGSAGGAGGSGGGGAHGQFGTPNTGGGGGGAQAGSAAGSGGSGIVVISYSYSPPPPPTVAIVSGNNQTGLVNQFNAQPFDVGVWNSAGTAPLVGTSVSFSVQTGGGLLATTNTGSPTLSNSITLTTDVDGTAQVYYQQPATAGVTSQIIASSGGASAFFSTLSAVAANPPSAPPWANTNTTSPTAIALSWGAATPASGGNPVGGYYVYRSGTQLNSQPLLGTSYTDSTVTAGTAYVYTVKAVDTVGALSTAATLNVSAPASSTSGTFEVYTPTP